MGFEIWTKGHHFVKNHLKFGQKCEDFEWSGFQKVGTIKVNVNVYIDEQRAKIFFTFI